MTMRFRNYIIVLKDRSAFYVTEEDGRGAMLAYSKGQALFVRGRMIAHALVGIIRPCNVVEDEEAQEIIATDERTEKLRNGELTIEESDGRLLLRAVATTQQLHAPMQEM